MTMRDLPMIDMNNHTIEDVRKYADRFCELYNSSQDCSKLSAEIIPGDKEGDYTVENTITPLKPLEMIEINFTEIV